MQKKHLILGLVATGIAVTGFSAASFAAKPTPEQRAERMIKRLDTSKDGKVSLDEMQAGVSATFKTIDTNGDGEITRDEIKAQREAFKDARKAMHDAKDKSGAEKAEAREKLRALRVGMLPGGHGKRFDRADTDKNGMLSQAEVAKAAEQMFKRRDRNGDGFIDVADFKKS